MAPSRPIHVVVLVLFLAATADCAGTSEISAITKKRSFLEKLNNLVSLVDRGFRSVGSNVKTLYGNFDLIGALATDKLHLSIRTLESLEHRRKPVATKPQPDVTTPQPDVTTPQPDVTTPPRVTTPQSVVTTMKTEACGDGWIKYGTSFFSFCKCIQKCSFNSARDKCREKQAELAKCTSPELENFFVLSLNTSFYILLGGNDRDEEGTWRWPDGSLLNASYTNWGADPSKKKTHNCLELTAWSDYGYPKRMWDDVPCDYLFPASSAAFVCEKKHL